MRLRRGARLIGIQTDTTSWDDVENMVSTTVSELGGVDILVNSAAMVGGQVRGTLEEAQESDLIEDLDTKVVGYFRCIKATVPHMKAKGWGRSSASAACRRGRRLSTDCETPPSST